MTRAAPAAVLLAAGLALAGCTHSPAAPGPATSAPPASARPSPTPVSTLAALKLGVSPLWSQEIRASYPEQPPPVAVRRKERPSKTR